MPLDFTQYSFADFNSASVYVSNLAGSSLFLKLFPVWCPLGCQWRWSRWFAVLLAGCHSGTLEALSLPLTFPISVHLKPHNFPQIPPSYRCFRVSMSENSWSLVTVPNCGNSLRYVISTVFLTMASCYEIPYRLTLGKFNWLYSEIWITISKRFVKNLF